MCHNILRDSIRSPKVSQTVRPVVLANSIRLSRAVDKRSVLVVEGSGDKKLYERFLADNQCKVVIAWGKPNVFTVIDLLSNPKFEGVLGIVDSDFDRIISARPQNTGSNIVHCDYHDLETMMIRSSALDVILRELGSLDKLFRLSSPPRDLLLKAALPIGALRLASIQLKINLKFEGLNMSKFIDSNTLVTDLGNLVDTVVKHSQRHDLSKVKLVKSLETILSSNHDPWELCAGDDLVDVLGLGLRRKFATRKAIDVTSDKLSTSLRMAFSREDFFNLDVVDRIREWERMHAPYTVLPRNPFS